MATRHVSFTLASGSYCVPVDQVVQILRNENVLQIPKAPSFVVGVVNMRGDVIPVIDLRKRLGLPAEETGRRRRIVVIQLGKRCYGLLVDEVREIVELDEGAASQDAATFFGARAEFVRAVARRGDGLFLLLDLAAVFSAGAEQRGEEAPRAEAGSPAGSGEGNALGPRDPAAGEGTG